MEIIINKASGDTLTIKLDEANNPTILDLKNQIQKKTGTPSNLIDLYLIKDGDAENKNENYKLENDSDSDSDSVNMLIKEDVSFLFIANTPTQRNYTVCLPNGTEFHLSSTPMTLPILDLKRKIITTISETTGEGLYEQKTAEKLKIYTSHITKKGDSDLNSTPNGTAKTNILDDADTLCITFDL